MLAALTDPVRLMKLRPANKADKDAIWEMFNGVVAPGDTYVAESDGHIVGSYILEKLRKRFRFRSLI